MHIFYSKGKTFMFAAGSKNKDSVYALRCEKFLSSYKMILNKPAPQGATFSFSSANKAFTVAFPTKPKNEFIKGDITLTKEDVSLYSSFDSKNKISYLVMLKEPFKGYFIDFDSAVFIQTFSEIKRGVLLKALTQDQVVLDGFPAVKFKIKAEVEGKTEVIYSIMTLRHNRFYNLTARGLANAEYETKFDNFFNSFRFLPYLTTPFEKHADKENLFTVNAPSVIYSAENKTARAEINKTFGDGGRTDYFAIDSNTAFSYSIMVVGFARYYWAEGENSLLNEYSRILFNDSLAVNNVNNGDSLVYKKVVFNGTTEGRELLLKDVRNSSFTRLRIIHYGDSIFVINIKGAHELVIDENADLFFTSFRFTKEKYITNVFTPKTDILLKDLQTADSRVRSEANKDQQSADNSAKFKAVKALEAGFRFPPVDLPKMLNALLFEYPPAKPGAVPIPDLLVTPILQYSNNSIITFIREHYSALKGKHEDIRMLMLNMLSASKIIEGFILLREILLHDPPGNASYDYMVLNCSTSPLSASALFPEIAVKITDELLGPVVLDLACMLIDSNRMQYGSIASYEDYIIQLGRKMYRQYLEKNSNSFYLPYTEAILKLLAKMNKKNARSVLNDFIEIQNKKLTQTIIVALARNGVAVSPEIIDRFCSTPGLRISLYDELYQMGKQSFFTGTYASQRSFAESFATLFTNKEIEESTPKTFDLITFRDSLVNHMLSRFYIFKVTCDYKYSSSSYTGIIGPFSPTADYFSLEEGKELFILYRKKFDSKNIGILFNDFISKIQK